MVQTALGYTAAIILMLAVAGKIRDRSAITEVSRLAEGIGVTRRLAVFTGPLLVLGEFGTAVALLVPRTAGWGAFAAALLFTGLTFGAHQVRRRVDGAQCRCFGGAAVRLRRRHVVRNGLLAAAAIAAALIHAGTGPVSLTVAEYVLTSAVAMAAATVARHLDTLMFLGGWDPDITPAYEGTR